MKVSDDKKKAYAEMVVLKLLDLGSEDGGMEIPVELPTELAPLQPILQELRFNGLVEEKTKARGALGALRGKPKTGVYALSQQGVEYLGRLIDEAEGYVNELEDAEVSEILAFAQRRRLDPIRIRFLWGWFEGEFDDLALFQERRNIEPVERLWAFYLTSNDFWDELVKDLQDA